MTQVHKSEAARKNIKPKNDALDRIRAAVQELHRAISDAVAKRGEAMKVELHSIPDKAKAALTSVKESLGAQDEATKKHLMEAITYLEGTQKHMAESAKTSGHAFETSIRKAVSDAYAATQKVSAAVAAKRTAEHTHSHS
jgi:ElaB/YqjD/DUF883 family membrane-anchored ribosome-binding protein